MARDNTFYNASKNLSQVRNYINNNGYKNGAGAAETALSRYVTDYSNRKPLDKSGLDDKDTGNGTGSKSTGSNVSGYGEGDYLSMLYAQRQQAAQDAYDKAKGLLDDAYSTASNNYANIYNRGVGQLGKSYNNSLSKINNNAMDAFRQAYVNKVLSENTLGQKLAAMGISGGESESALTKLLTQYGNSRSNIQRTLDTNRSDLETDYNSNLANLYNAYQSQMAGLDQQRASQLAQLLQNLNNQVAGAQSDYFSLLAKNPQYIQAALNTAMGNMNAYAPTEAVATNDITPVSVYQKNDMGDTATNYSRQRWLDEIANQRANNATDKGIMDYLIKNGLTNEQIAEYLYA